MAMALTAVTFLPYLFDRSLQGASPLYGWYSWYAFNVTDNCVYLSWMRQYADGAWFHRNLFTTLHQSGHQINLLFLLLGRLGGWTGLPLILLYHAARAVASLAVLLLVWRLAGLVGFTGPGRRIAWSVVAVSAGLGWVPGLWERAFAGPVDTWQPEAVTFLSLYLFPLFGVSLALVLGILVNLLEAERRRSTRHAIYAGLCGFVLGNIHTYDIITVSGVWVGFLAVELARSRRCRRDEFGPDRGTFARMLVAGLPPAVSAGHMFWVYKTETVFAQRVAVPTLTPSLVWVLLGFGLLVPLAVVGIISALRSSESGEYVATDGPLFLLVWAVVNIGMAYAPVSFQRKLLMGAHIPVALLAGWGMATIARELRGMWRPLLLAVGLIVMSLTNIRFMLRDRGGLRHGGETVRAFLLAGERSAIDWLRRNAEPGSVVQPLPWLAVGPDGRAGFVDTTVACFVPGLTGHAVNAGHWGETPDFGHAMGRWLRFLMPDTPDNWRKQLLQETGVRYVVFSQKRAEARDTAADALLGASSVPSRVPYLRRIEQASSEDADVYEVVGL